MALLACPAVRIRRVCEPLLSDSLLDKPAVPPVEGSAVFGSKSMDAGAARQLVRLRGQAGILVPPHGGPHAHRSAGLPGKGIVDFGTDLAVTAFDGERRRMFSFPTGRGHTPQPLVHVDQRMDLLAMRFSHGPAEMPTIMAVSPLRNCWQSNFGTYPCRSRILTLRSPSPSERRAPPPTKNRKGTRTVPNAHGKTVRAAAVPASPLEREDKAGKMSRKGQAARPVDMRFRRPLECGHQWPPWIPSDRVPRVEGGSAAR